MADEFTTFQKPPLGVAPRIIWEHYEYVNEGNNNVTYERIRNLTRALYKYTKEESNSAKMLEWAEELVDRLKEVRR